MYQRNRQYPYAFLQRVTNKPGAHTFILEFIPLEEAEAAQIASMNAYLNLDGPSIEKHKKQIGQTVEKTARSRRITKYEMLGSATIGTLWRPDSEGYVPVAPNEIKQLVEQHRNSRKTTNQPGL